MYDAIYDFTNDVIQDIMQDVIYVHYSIAYNGIHAIHIDVVHIT